MRTRATGGAKNLLLAWRVFGELVNDVLPAVEESKGASSKEWSASNHHLYISIIIIITSISISISCIREFLISNSSLNLFLGRY